MWNGKRKAITFSYDDGVKQDVRLIEILDKYGLRATFNLNSSLFGQQRELGVNGIKVRHDKVSPTDVASIYKNHEVAAHTLTHPHLTTLADEEIVRQVEQDRLKLSEMVGYEVVGMAYPGGGFQNSDRVERAIRNHTGIRYARTISLSYSFKPSENLYRYNPTAFHMDIPTLYHLADEFFNVESEGVFYIWGHSYEFDAKDTWAEFEKFCAYVSGRPDVFYGTNREILLP